MTQVLDLRDFLQAELGRELEILRPLGKGSAAHVFLAREAPLKRLVAVKVLRPSILRSEVMLRRFEREAESIARIHHPNVAAVHRIGRLSNGVPFMVLEYIEGRTTEDALAARGTLPASDTRRILSETASALAAAHARGIIHRDVRPNNILLEHHTGRAVLTDFGVAAFTDAMTDSRERLTATGQMLGDVRYVSPEQLRGEPVTAQSDIFSFGVLAYELLTGTRPFDAPTMAQVAALRFRDARRPVRELRASIDAALADLVDRCLAVEPNRRPTSEEVVRILQDGPATVAVPQTGLPGFLHELRRRHVYHVGVSYLAGAFIILQAADLILPAMQTPPFAYKGLVALVMVGFPLALVLSWMYDIGWSGIERTDELASAGRGRMVLAWSGLLLSAVVFSLLGWLFFFR